MSLERKLFQNPTAEYRPSPLWVWDDEPNERELVRQIRLMHKAGLGGFFIHADGLRAESMNEALLSRLRVCVEEAARLGMKVWLCVEATTVRGVRLCLRTTDPSPAGANRVATHGDLAFYEEAAHAGIEHSHRGIADKEAVRQCVKDAIGRTMAELYGGSGYNLSFEDRKWIADSFLALGVNFISHRQFPYSMRGGRKRDCPPTLFYQQPWWLEDRMVEDYLARLCYALSQGKPYGGESGNRAKLEGVGAESVWIREHEVDGQRVVFLANTNRTEAFAGKLSILARGGLEGWDATSGSVAAFPSTPSGEWLETELRLEPAGSVLLSTTPSPSYGTPESILDPRSSIPHPLGPEWDIQRLDPNAFTLDVCRYQVAGMNGWSERMPLIGVQGTLDERKYIGPLTLEFRFRAARTLNTNVQTAVALEDAALWDVRVNGRVVRYEGLPFYRDLSFQPIDISTLVVEGENVIELRRHFERTGLESIYLIGDFCVRGTPGTSPVPVNPDHKTHGLGEIPVLRYSPQWTLADDRQTVFTGDLVAQGYPFFAGRAILNQRVTIAAPRPGERVFFEMERHDAIVTRVRLNGYACGDIAWHPYRADLTDHVQEGENLLEIELVSSLRNLLGPHHNPGGELVAVQAGDFSRKEWTDDYFLVPFGLTNPAIRTYRVP